MKRFVILVLLVGCAACGGGSSGGAASATGCATALDAAGSLGQLVTGAQNGTETNGDVEKGMQSVAGQMGNVALIASGKLKSLAADAQIRAGRVRVDMVDGKSKAGVAQVSALGKDVTSIDAICK